MVSAASPAMGGYPRTWPGALVDVALTVGRVVQLALIRAFVGLGPSASPASIAAVLVLDRLNFVLHRIRQPSIRCTSIRGTSIGRATFGRPSNGRMSMDASMEKYSCRGNEAGGSTVRGAGVLSSVPRSCYSLRSSPVPVMVSTPLASCPPWPRSHRHH
jgi:hypothetical protein